jgi:hypothetical protein
MQLANIHTPLLDEIEHFDNAILPLGLYGSDDLSENTKPGPKFMEWSRVIQPFIRSRKGKIGGIFRNYDLPKLNCCDGSVSLPEVGDFHLSLVKISLIKVRKYGSSFRVDKHENRAERWQQTDLSGSISTLWKAPGADAPSGNRLLIFIGFDKTQRPFERELNDLHSQLNWDAKNVEFETRFWDDRANRGFGVRLAVWSRQQPT